MYWLYGMHTGSVLVLLTLPATFAELVTVARRIHKPVNLDSPEHTACHSQLEEKRRSADELFRLWQNITHRETRSPKSEDYC
jgi:hypothetical protein